MSKLVGEGGINFVNINEHRLKMSYSYSEDKIRSSPGHKIKKKKIYWIRPKYCSLLFISQ